MKDFDRSFAVILGINDYQNGVPKLTTAGPDAQELARILKDFHGYEPLLRLDSDVSLAKLRELLEEELPAKVTENDRVLFYFAGHGVATDGDDGPEGHILPQDARLDRPDSFLQMTELNESLCALKCRHMLVILDCCFAGAFRWSSIRNLRPLPDVIHREQYDYFVKDPAWQALASAAYDQTAQDKRHETDSHSPFAKALFEGLRGEADLCPRGKGDGVITATELYMYLRDGVEGRPGEYSNRQTPTLWPIHRKHGKGEYIFLVPNRELQLPPAPPLNKENNPYRGLLPYDEQHQDLFFGRDKVKTDLFAKVVSQPMTTVVGASGTGKSSLVKAGLLPKLRDEKWQILSPLRPGKNPLQALATLLSFAGEPTESAIAPAGTSPEHLLTSIVKDWRQGNPTAKLILVVDQLEELVTTCRDKHERELFLGSLSECLLEHTEQFHLVLTLRSDFEPQFASSALKNHWKSSRFVAPPMTQDELREAIESPATAKVLRLESPSPETPQEKVALVDQLINEVVQMPGALPLLSFTLSEMYFKYLERRGTDRCLTVADYEELGGVAGALRRRAREEYQSLEDDRLKATMRKAMLRMVSLEGGEIARRRVPLSELTYKDAEENQRIAQVIDRLTAARLIVKDVDGEGVEFIEPAHDALVRGWNDLWEWIHEEQQHQDNLLLQRRLTEAANDWDRGKRETGQLWDDDPRLPQLTTALAGRQNWFSALESEFVDGSVKRRTSRRRRRLGVAIASFVILGALTTVAITQAVAASTAQGEAEDAQRLAEDKTREALVESNKALAAFANAEIQKQTAIVSKLQADFARDAATKAEGVAKEERNRANEERDRAVELAQISLSRQLAIQSTSRIEHELDLSLLLGNEATRTHQTVEALGALMDGLQYSPHLRTFLESDLSMVKNLACNPKGGSFISSGNYNKSIEMWDLQGPRLLRRLPTDSESEYVKLVYDPEGRVFASATANGKVTVWNARSGDPLVHTQTNEGANIVSLAFSKDGSTLAAALNNNQVIRWDAKTLKPLGSALPNPTYLTTQIAFTDDGELLSVGSEDDQIFLWDVLNSKSIGKPIEAEQNSIKRLAVSQDGTRVASAGYNTTVVVWDIRSHQQIGKRMSLRGSGVINYAETLAFSNDNRSLVVGIDQIVRIWNVESGESLTPPMPGNPSLIHSVAFTADGNSIISGNDRGTIIVWDVPNRPALAQTRISFPSEIGSVAFSSDNKTVAIASDTNVYLSTTGNLQHPTVLSGHSKPVSEVAFSPDGSILASASNDKTIIFWNVATGLPLGPPLIQHQSEVNTLSFSPDGRFLASGDDEGFVLFWDVATRQANGPPLKVEKAAQSLAFSLNSKLIAIGFDKKVTLWRVNERKRFGKTFTHHEQRVVSVAFSPDGETIASADSWHTVWLWKISSQQPVGRIEAGSVFGIRDIAFNNDGSVLAADMENGRIDLWDVRTRQQIGEGLKGHSRRVTALAFSKDGNHLLSGSEDQTVIVWDVNFDSWSKRARQIANRSFTNEERIKFFGPQMMSIAKGVTPSPNGREKTKGTIEHHQRQNRPIRVND